MCIMIFPIQGTQLNQVSIFLLACFASERMKERFSVICGNKILGPVWECFRKQISKIAFENNFLKTVL